MNEFCSQEFYLHHENHSVESDHDQHRVLKRRRGHKVPQPVLEGLSVLGHVAGHRFGADGKVNASPLIEKNVTKQTNISHFSNLSAKLSVKLGILPRLDHICHSAMHKFSFVLLSPAIIVTHYLPDCPRNQSTASSLYKIQQLGFLHCPHSCLIAWLPVVFRTDFKILLLVSKSLIGLAPSYIADPLTPYTPACTLRSADQTHSYKPVFN